MKTFIFDIDGTLINTEEAVLKSLQLALKNRFNLDKKIDDLIFTLGIPAAKIMQELQVDPVEGVEAWHEELPAFHQLMTPYSGIEETIAKLHEANVNLAIVTSKTIDEYEAEVAKFPFTKYFDQIITSSMTTKHKPEPEPILKALELLNVTSADAIYFGDTIYDLQSAHAANVKFGLANWGAHDHGQFNTADFRFNHPAEILNLL